VARGLSFWAGRGGRVVPFALHIRNDDRDRIPSLVLLGAVDGRRVDGAPALFSIATQREKAG
jgi:hypothetical protein